MEREILKMISAYFELYEYVTAAPRTKDDIFNFVTEDLKKSRSTGSAQAKDVFDGKFPMLKVEGETAGVDELVYREFMEKMTKFGGPNGYKLFISPPPAPKGKNGESNIPPVGSVESPVVQKLQKQLNDKKAKITALEKKLKGINAEHQTQMEALQQQHEQEMTILRNAFSEELSGICLQLLDKTCEEIHTEMDKKMFVPASISSKPKEKLAMDCFLDDPAKTLDVPMLVSKYGGEKDSIYEVIDESEKKLEPKDYIDRVSRALFKTNIFKRRLEDESRLRLVDAGTVSPERAKYIKRKKMTGAEIYENRLRTINEILTSPGLTNQQKLAFYAGWAEYKGSDFAENLKLAGEKGLDAGHVIRLLENPLEHDNYHNVRGFLLQALNSSEARLKREAVKELICGEWIVEAEYGGKTCRFQMVPVEEIVAFKKALEKLQLNEAIKRANNMIGVEREAVFEDDDPMKRLFVERKKSLQERTEEMSEWMRQQEASSGVDVHEPVNEDFEDDIKEEGEANGTGKE